jgi:hypothetical protein
MCVFWCKVVYSYHNLFYYNILFQIVSQKLTAKLIGYQNFKEPYYKINATLLIINYELRKNEQCCRSPFAARWGVFVVMIKMFTFVRRKT